MRRRKLIFDLETTAIGVKPIVVHVLAIMDLETRQIWVFRQNSVENIIAQGIAMLNEAEIIIGHNIAGYDCRVLWEVYPDLFNPQGIFRDSLVMARMTHADQKEKDFKLWKRKQLDGGLIGSQELKAWGQRLGLHKGDYMQNRLNELEVQFPDMSKEDRMIIVWSVWCQEMEDYCVRDLEVTAELWKMIEGRYWSPEAILLEHQVHDEMERVRENGFPLDLPAARALEDELRREHEKLSAIAIEHFGSWWAPDKWKGEGEHTTYVDPLTNMEGKNLPKFKPRAIYGEDESRVFWGEVSVPRRTTRFKDILRGDVEAGCPFTPVKIIDFNPSSRTQIINRLQKVYGWEPQEFTEKGTPSVSDEILRDLATTIPICIQLAEIFYYKKRLGQLVDGQNGLIGKAQERGDSKIHARINVGGTVTNRASHSNPNIGQVPRVVFKKIPILDAQGKPIIGNDGKPVLSEKEHLMKGRDGDHGWDFRNLFCVPNGWTLMGADQKGIELRCLGHFMAEYDDGAYMRLVVESDPHDLHQKAMELDSRDTAKTFIYAMIYGAQDYKLGITIDPTLVLQPTKAKNLGAEMRRRLMTRIPALGQVIKATQREASRKFLIGLDGRKLYVRGSHSALNTKLQGAAATIAKKWCVLFEQMCEDEGFVHGWDGDFAIVTWVHDEIQVAIREGDDSRINRIREIVHEAAKEAGQSFNFRGPVDVDTKFGKTWATTH